jgi:hypothetical protein
MLGMGQLLFFKKWNYVCIRVVLKQTNFGVWL